MSKTNQGYERRKGQYNVDLTVAIPELRKLHQEIWDQIKRGKFFKPQRRTEMASKSKKEKDVVDKKAAAKKAEKPANDTLGTKEVASKLGVSPASLRRMLRAENGKREKGSYTRYEWAKDDDLSELRDMVERHQRGSEEEEEKPAKGKKAAKATKAKASKKSKKAEENEEEEVEDLDAA